MRKIIVLAAIAVIAATTAVWSIVTFAKPKAAFHVQSTEELAPISPHEIMIKPSRSKTGPIRSNFLVPPLRGAAAAS
jgi:hypothetical protein